MSWLTCGLPGRRSHADLQPVRSTCAPAVRSTTCLSAPRHSIDSDARIGKSAQSKRSTCSPRARSLLSTRSAWGSLGSVKMTIMLCPRLPCPRERRGATHLQEEYRPRDPAPPDPAAGLRVSGDELAVAVAALAAGTADGLHAAGHQLELRLAELALAQARPGLGDVLDAKPRCLLLHDRPPLVPAEIASRRLVSPVPHGVCKPRAHRIAARRDRRSRQAPRPTSPVTWRSRGSAAMTGNVGAQVLPPDTRSPVTPEARTCAHRDSPGDNDTTIWITPCGASAVPGAAGGRGGQDPAVAATARHLPAGCSNQAT